jgi:hypothetical protein
MPILTPHLAVTDSANGGGFTATITGGTAGASNQLAYQLTTDLGDQEVWTSAGSRSGPGTITGTAPKGYRWWRVLSTLGTESVVSNLVRQALTDGADSVLTRCLDAAVATIHGLDLNGVQQVKWMERPDDQVLEFPCVLLTSWEQVEQLRGGTLQRDDIGHPVLGAIMTRAEVGVEEDKVPLQKWRQAIRRAFINQRLVGVPEVMWCEYEPLGIVQEESAKYQWKSSNFLLRFITREPRGV